MTDKKNHGRRALDAGSELATVAGTLVDLGATGGALAGGKLLWDAVTAGIAGRRRKQAQKYLELLAEALGQENTAALAVELDQAGENEVWETIEEGFRAMMGAINETAKRCIALLVADYVVRKALPDRDFQVLGGLLAASDEAILNALITITRQLEQAVVRLPSDQVSTCTLAVSASTSETGRLFALFQHRVNGLVPETIASDGEVCPNNLQMVSRLLSQHGLADMSAVPGGTMMWHDDTKPILPGAVSILGIQETHRFRRLHVYLRPALFDVADSILRHD